MCGFFRIRPKIAEPPKDFVHATAGGLLIHRRTEAPERFGIAEAEEGPHEGKSGIVEEYRADWGAAATHDEGPGDGAEGGAGVRTPEEWEAVPQECSSNGNPEIQHRVSARQGTTSMTWELRYCGEPLLEAEPRVTAQEAEEVLHWLLHRPKVETQEAGGLMHWPKDETQAEAGVPTGGEAEGVGAAMGLTEENGPEGGGGSASCEKEEAAVEGEEPLDEASLVGSHWWCEGEELFRGLERRLGVVRKQWGAAARRGWANIAGDFRRLATCEGGTMGIPDDVPDAALCDALGKLLERQKLAAAQGWPRIKEGGQDEVHQHSRKARSAEGRRQLW